jgi:hypothetical protein
MAKCEVCNKAVSVWAVDLGSGLCAACKAERANAEAKRRDTQAREERLKRSVQGRAEPQSEPVSGPMLIGVSIGIGAIGAFIASSSDSRPLGLAVVGIAAMVYLAGVIRWGVAGSQLVQLDRLQRQNAEIVELLETIAAQGKNGSELDLLQRLRASGQLSEVEYRAQRNALIRQPGDVG